MDALDSNKFSLYEKAAADDTLGNRAIDEQEHNYYACQIKTARFGAEAQEVLRRSSCAIVGMGGLGCPAAQYLAASGIGLLALYDDDSVELSNINRQILYTPEDIGRKKVTCAAARLRAQNPFIHIKPKDTKIHKGNWKDEFTPYDIVLDCSDNFYTKFLIHDACLVLGKKLVQAGIYQMSGQVYYFDFSPSYWEDETRGCYRCLWEHSPDPSKARDCAVAGVLSVLAGSMGLMQANLALLGLLGKAGQFESSMHIFDLEELEWTRIQIDRRNDCLCKSFEEMQKHMDALSKTLAIQVESLESLAPESFSIIDVRDDKDKHNNQKFAELSVINMTDAQLNDIASFASQLNAEQHYVAVCYKGVRSLGIASKLRDLGISKVQSFAGGYERL